MNGSAVHRIRLQRGTALAVRVGAEIRPDEVIGLRREPLAPVSVPVARPLHRKPDEIADTLQVRPGSRVRAGEVLARENGHEVTSPQAGLVLAVARGDGSILIAPLGPEQPVIGHVRGRVHAIEENALLVEVPAARVRGKK